MNNSATRTGLHSRLVTGAGIQDDVYSRERLISDVPLLSLSLSFLPVLLHAFEKHEELESRSSRFLSAFAILVAIITLIAYGVLSFRSQLSFPTLGTLRNFFFHH